MNVEMNFSMIAKIIKITDEIKNSSEYESIRSYSYNLPLFNLNLNYAYQKELSEYVLQLWRINNGVRYLIWIPFLNEDDFKKVNVYWDWVVEEGLDKFEFLL